MSLLSDIVYFGVVVSIIVAIGYVIFGYLPDSVKRFLEDRLKKLLKFIKGKIT